MIHMNWYPWLDSYYQRMVSFYKKGKGHHALLLSSTENNGEIALFYAISRWLMCIQPNGIQSCNSCKPCQLMMAGGHPDFYRIEVKQGDRSIGINEIRRIIDNLYGYSCQNGVKIVLFSNSEYLTEQASNALLKILEEPPKYTYFLLRCEEPRRLLTTLKSRCFHLTVPVPEVKVSLHWLQKIGIYNEYDPISVMAALRVCNRAPLKTRALLKPARWQARLTFCADILETLDSRDFMKLVSSMKIETYDAALHWLLRLLADGIKWHQGAQEFIDNIDQIPLVKTLARRCTMDILYAQWKQWLYFRRQCEIPGINMNHMLISNLIEWESSVRVSS